MTTSTTLSSSNDEEPFHSPLLTPNDDDDDENHETPSHNPPSPKLPHPSSSSSPSHEQTLAMISNFSTSYNTINIGLVLDILSSHTDTTSTTDSMCASSLLVGMIVGQLVGGMLGDVLGRFRSLYIVMSIQVLASLGSAVADLLWGGGGLENVLDVLMAWRFLLGVGCGGVYPLAAVISAEGRQVRRDDDGNDETDEKERVKSVAVTFSTQGVGFLTVPLVTWALVSIFGEQSDAVWRIVLGLGCIPGLIVLSWAAWNEIRSVRRNTASITPLRPPEVDPLSENLLPSEDTRPEHENDSPPAKNSILHALQTESSLLPKLLGTALTWFLFDVLFYGNALFQPIVLTTAFGSSEALTKTARDTTLLSIIALPGYFASIIALSSDQSPKYIQTQGFAIMAILYAVMGTLWSTLTSFKLLLLLLYGLTFFYANYGPNATTFLLPSMTYSKECRSTLNGICAACGKSGALLGAMMFEPLADAIGDGGVMVICACVAVLAMVVTLMFVREYDRS